MRQHTIWAAAALLGFGALGACSGRIGGASGGDATGGTTGQGTGTGGGSGGSGSSSGAGGTTTTGVPGQLNLDGSPQYFRMVRLTNAQWARAVQDVLKLPAPSGLEQSFQSPVIGTTDFSNNELVLDVNQESWADFQQAAETLANQVTATDTALAQVYSGTDPAGFIQTMGRRTYRRPLTSAEQSAYMTLYGKGSSLSGTRSTFAKGASMVLRAMLQSPNFLYRTEMAPKGQPLSGYEIAAKLSLWLRGTTPSDSLLDSAAGPGKLDTADGAATLATTMVGESTATSVLRQFHAELYHFDRYAQITKVNVPTYNTAMNAEFLDVSNLFFDDIFTKGLGLKDILTSTKGFVGPKTASLYGLTPPASGYVQQDLGAQRLGYFSQVPFLTLFGFNADPDSIHRGVTLNLDVLCAKLGPPAANLPPIPPLMPGQTNRQRIDTLTSSCGAQCHNDMINPLGFSFEHFDGMGQYRDTENGGLTIDASGSYSFTDGAKSFSNSGDLMNVMAADQQTHLCYAKKLSSFALQRDVIATDMPLLQSLAQASMSTNGSIKNMILQLVRSDAFRTRVGGN
ncbi:MAG TPA: DUF1592 domain-containing protein [Polyangia bacterium]|nr:DUF1592 domain-containing protein [Polyangia bacterium]